MSFISFNPETCFSQPFINNPSFETNSDITRYPWNYISGFHSDNSTPDKSWIDWCIGQCSRPDEFKTPEPDNCTRWFIPTFGTADYFYRVNNTAQRFHISIPLIQLWDGDDNAAYKERRETNTPPPNTQGNAYCGISLRNNADVTASDYREYLETKLGQTLTENNTYWVSFWVSRSKPIPYPPATQQVPNPIPFHNGHLNKIGAYLSDHAILDFPSGNTQYTGVLYDQNNMQTCVPQICSETLTVNYANQVTGYDNWQKIEGRIIVPQGKFYDYITIGSFETRLKDFEYDAGFVPDPSCYFPNAKGTYYFIDDVEITNITSDCNCGKEAYQFEIKPKVNQTDPTQCCYTYTLKVPLSSDEAICPLTNYKITFIWQEGIEQDVVTSGGAVPKGPVGVSGEFCIKKPSGVIPFGKHKIKIEYTTPSKTCDPVIIDNIVCDCLCNESLYGTEDIRNKLIVKEAQTSPPGKCCFDLYFNNNDDCHIPFNELKALHIHPTNNPYSIQGDDYVGIDFNPGLWSVEQYIDNYGKEKWFERPSNFDISPHQEYFLGTICIPEDGHVYDFNIAFDWTIPSPGGGESYCYLINKSLLQCKQVPEQCCQDINVQVINYNPYGDFNFLILWSQITNKGHCKIFSIKIFNPNDRISPLRVSPTQSLAFLTGPEYKYLTHLNSNISGGGLEFDICFYDINGDLICCKSINIPPPPSYKKLNNDMQGNKKEMGIINSKLYPTESLGEFRLNFVLNDEQHTKIDVINILGETVQNIFDGFLEKFNPYDFKIYLSNSPQGNYFVRLSSQEGIKNIPFILIK